MRAATESAARAPEFAAVGQPALVGGSPRDSGEGVAGQNGRPDS